MAKRKRTETVAGESRPAIETTSTNKAKRKRAENVPAESNSVAAAAVTSGGVGLVGRPGARTRAGSKAGAGEGKGAGRGQSNSAAAAAGIRKERGTRVGTAVGRSNSAAAGISKRARPIDLAGSTSAAAAASREAEAGELLPEARSATAAVSDKTKPVDPAESKSATASRAKGIISRPGSAAATASKSRAISQPGSDPVADTASNSKHINEPGSNPVADPESKTEQINQSGPTPPAPTTATTTTIQIITGSYDKILHGITAFIHPVSDGENAAADAAFSYTVSFADSFLFSAHTSAIRCLALSAPSPPTSGQPQKLFLASGSNDERINVYSLSAHPPKMEREGYGALSSLLPRPVRENSKNRELGTLLHHSSGITSLCFPTRSKLLSSSEDSTVGVARTRDWSLMSAIKAPIPKEQGRPSGDTAPAGGTPSGVNSFAVHPSMKVMITVSKGERCMRLWNLVTGKKAGVLNFGRETLREVGEGKRSTGEGRSVAWGSSSEGDEFAVGFDRDAAVYGMDGLPRCRVIGHARTRLHRIRYITLRQTVLLVVSTEDGRIMFFSTSKEHLWRGEAAVATETAAAGAGSENGAKVVATLPTARLVGQISGKDGAVSGRIKDFVLLHDGNTAGAAEELLHVVGGSSDGKIRLWRVGLHEIEAALSSLGGAADPRPGSDSGRQLGTLLGTYESHNRITCLEAFVMVPRPEGAEDSEWEGESEGGSDDGSDGGSSTD